MEFRVVPFHKISKDEWRQLTVDASFYQSIPWVQVCVDALQSEAVLLCLYDSHQLIGGMPGIITSRLKMKSFASMPYGTYGGIIWHTSPNKTHVTAFLEGLQTYLDKQLFSRVNIADFSGGLAEWDAQGFSRIHAETQVLSLGQEGYAPDKKTAVEIRNGEKRGGRVRQLTGSEFTDEYFNLYRRAEQRHERKKLLYDQRFYLALAKHMRENTGIYWNGLFVDDVMIGAQIHFIFGLRQYYWQAVSANDAREYRPDYRLLYDAIRFGQKRGVTEINLGASPADAHGLVFFKKRWGSVKQEYTLYEFKSRLRKLAGR